ncbi:hypothetical protein GCM10010530_39400 [Kribbella aluminosa]
MPFLKRTGAACASVVIVPSGFAHVVDVSERSDSTSTREPCDRADTTADTRSGRESTLATGGFGSVTGAATAGSCTSNAVASKENDTTAAVTRDSHCIRARRERDMTNPT